MSETAANISTQERAHVIEKAVRCPNCDKLLTKLKFFISLPADIAYGEGSTISKIFKTIEIKMGAETKCNRCKHMCYELNVV